MIGVVALVALSQTVSAPPAAMHADPFYAKCVFTRGLPIMASKNVSDAALVQAAGLAAHMLQGVRADAIVAMHENHIRIAIIGAHEQTTDIPEYRDLNTRFPGTDWNKRTRGVGATSEIPVISGAEENLLALPGDRYKGECIFIHEFGHTIADMGVASVDKSFLPSLRKAYRQAVAEGLWKKTYASSNESEYWAEGVQDYFDCNAHVTPPNGIHNEIWTRRQLAAYDPRLYTLLRRVFGEYPWRWSPPTSS
ncbi:hypothetical protein [Fimbriimonas ginsengisoli]|uniref:Alpha-glucosidase n=1 Tax=Fimbriimonas ginsengisoli Gsoil 348 TaxID=661478 RepID=A0A068NL60_FIMGI|nr:hypothetical protein [Fimbriimonas ginsengisoli]AIE84211.1 Alpha-glucosidase [Fimbriimonas ginsengisoli Gsoil 348]